MEVIDDDTVIKSKTKRVILCSGKVFYDLKKEQTVRSIKDIAIIRLEQMFPFPIKQLTSVVKKYPKAELFWLQEEPENMGGWSFIQRMYGDHIKKVISRKSSASPATGFMKVHLKEQNQIIQSAFE